jgi:hypothetical protein
MIFPRVTFYVFFTFYSERRSPCVPLTVCWITLCAPQCLLRLNYEVDNPHDRGVIVPSIVIHITVVLIVISIIMLIYIVLISTVILIPIVTFIIIIIYIANLNSCCSYSYCYYISCCCCSYCLLLLAFLPLTFPGWTPLDHYHLTSHEPGIRRTETAVALSPTGLSHFQGLQPLGTLRGNPPRLVQTRISIPPWFYQACPSPDAYFF